MSTSVASHKRNSRSGGRDQRPRLTSALLKRAAAAAMKHAELGALITEAFRERYGCTFSDVDADQLIDALDYGLGGTPTVKECDAEMARCGAPALSSKERPHG